jgi:hypothetical protein
MRWAGHTAYTGEERNAYRFSVGRPEGKGSLGRPRLRWEGNIKKRILKKLTGRAWTGFIWLSIGASVEGGNGRRIP